MTHAGPQYVEARTAPSTDGRVPAIVLLAVLAVLALLTVTVGSLTAPLRSLEQAIASGKVTHVEIEGEMQAGGVGHAVVTIVWRADTFSRVTEVMQVRGSADTVGELPTSMAA